MTEPPTLGEYRLLRTLGEGAMGTVHLAEGPGGARVAVKVLRSDLARAPGMIARFMREAEAGTRVRDDHVVRVLDFDLLAVEEPPTCLLVLEYVEGQSVRDLLGDLGQVPEALAREIGRQGALGLAAIHAQGIVHRDLKPENLLITPEHVVRIADLGVAKVLDAAVALTHEGQFAGSLAYASPEQIRGGEIGATSDLYSLGVVLHELLSGVNPFDLGSAAEVMHAHVAGDVPDVLDVAPDTTPFLAEVVRTLLDKTPGRRIESAAALAGILAEGEGSAWWRARADDAARRRSAAPRVPVRRDAALHGRADDLALLASSWSRARAGAGMTVLVLGEAGIGKSRLVDAFFGALAGADCRVLYGSFPPGGGGAIADALVAHLGIDDLGTKIGRLLAATPLLAPPLAAWLRHEPPPEGAASLHGDALHTALVRLLRALAAERPLVWAIEDLHFADDDSRNAAVALARAVEGHRVLLVLTSRPLPDGADFAPLDRLENFQRTSLARLGPREVQLLVRDAFRSERLADKLGARIALASDGNPFFVFEMVRGLKQGQFVTELPDGTWVDTKAIDEIPVPEAVRDLVAVRLAGLDRDAREMLDVGAVLGFEFDPDVIADVSGSSRLDVLRDLAHVERTSGVVRAKGRMFRFDHHQIQEVVYGDLPDALREEYHAAVATALERRAGTTIGGSGGVDGGLCVDLVEHLLRGNRGTHALRHLDAALVHLEGRHLNAQAIALTNRALAVPGLLAGRARFTTLLRVARLLGYVWQREAQRTALEEALSLADASDDPALRAPVRVALGSHLIGVSRHAAARVVLTEALAFARETANLRAEAQATVNLGIVLERLGHPADALEQYERGVGLAREAGDRRTEAAAEGNAGGVLRHLGRYAEARTRSERSLAVAREIGDLRVESRAAGSLGSVLEHLGRHAEAEAQHERQLALAREIGDRHGEGVATGRLGNLFSSLGRNREAGEQHERQLALAREIGDRRGEASATECLGVDLEALGRFAAARSHHERALALGREIGDRAVEVMATGNLGNIAERLGRWAEAEAQQMQSLAIASEIGHRVGQTAAELNLGFVLRCVGRYGSARAHIGAALSLATESGDRRFTGVALEVLADVEDEEGHEPEALRLADEGLDLLRAVHADGGVADALIEIADRRRRAGDLAAARAAIDDALSLTTEQARPAESALCLALLACLPGGDASKAEAAAAEAGDGLTGRTAVRVRFLLWEATHARAHLVEAKRLLDTLVEHAPSGDRESMLRDVRLHREIVAAASGI